MTVKADYEIRQIRR